MLREIKTVRQVEKDHPRRLFSDEDFELYVWYNPDHSFFGFQLCYDLTEKAKAVTWTEDRGYSHHAIDTGDESPEANRTPMMTPHAHFDAPSILDRFRRSDHDLPKDIQNWVQKKIAAYPPSH